MQKTLLKRRKKLGTLKEKIIKLLNDNIQNKEDVEYLRTLASILDLILTREKE